MTPVMQSIQGQHGDCFRACIASILNLPLAEVPHFYENDLTGQVVPQATIDNIAAWFTERGLFLWTFNYAEDPRPYMSILNPGVHYILSGVTRRGRNHACVYRGGVLAHDPSGEDSPLTGPMENGMWVVEVVGKLT